MALQSNNDAASPICTICGSPIPPHYNYCEKCGTPIDVPQTTDSCPNCGAILYPEDRFCTKCGLSTLKQAVKPVLPKVMKTLLTIVVLVPIIGLAFYKLWGWMSLGVGIWLLFALALS